jgi:hypothetical protein
MKRRSGRTVTRTISLDVETDRILREEAALHYGGNVSNVIVALAKDARQRAAAGELLARFDGPAMSDEEAEALILKSLKPPRRTRRSGRAA